MPDESPRQTDQRILDKLDRHGEVLTRLDTKMESLISNGGGKGRIPDLERDVEEHSAQINTFSGGLHTSLWFMAGIGTLLLGLGGIVLAHILGGSK